MIETKKLPNKTLLIVGLIFLAGFALRFVTITAPYTTDERKNIVVAKDLGWGNLPMEDKYVTHPLLNVYVTRLGMMIFDQSKFGVRFLHLLFGSLTLLLVYLLVREIGEREGLLALTLLAFNQFHIHVSIKAENNSLLLFLCTLSILLFYFGIVKDKRPYIYWLGPVMGLAFLTKSVVLLLAVGFFLYLLLSKHHRQWLARRQLWISVGLFFLTISPWIFWSLLNGSSQLMFNKEMYDPDQFMPRLTAINFYLIQIFSWLKGIDYHMLISWEDAILDGITGIFYLLGIAAAIFMVHHELKRLLLLIFLAIMGILTFFTSPGLPWGEFWWAAPSVIPAVCLTAAAGAHAARKNWGARVVVSLFIGYALVNSIIFISTAGEEFDQPPRRLATFVDNDFIVAEIHLDKGRNQAALNEMESLRQQTPNNVDVLNYYGLVAWQDNRMDKAVDLWLHAASLEPGYRSWHSLLEVKRDLILNHFVSQAARNPDDPRVRFLLGALYYHYGDDKLSTMDLTRSVELNPLNHKAQFYLGLCHFRQQNYEDAIKAFQAVLDGHPHDYRALHHLGRIYQELGQDEEAIEHFKAAITLNPDDAHSHFELSHLYQGKPSLAGPMDREARAIYHQDIKYRVQDHMSGRYKSLFKSE